MSPTHLNEHDANQGAQSSGEFLGMTGNSGWYLLGSGGATILMVIVLWGILGVSLLLCLFVGLALGTLAVAYVFTLKNNRPAHYDTDFFEAALVEAGVRAFAFGPRTRRAANPFGGFGEPTAAPAHAAVPRRERRHAQAAHASHAESPHSDAAPAAVAATRAKKDPAHTEQGEPMVARREYDRLQERLAAAEELLDDALAERAEG